MPTKLKIKGGKPLRGSVKISGSKNAVLPILCASLMAEEGVTTLRNVPDISDTHTLLALLEYLGAKTTFAKNVATIDASKLKNRPLPHEMVKRMRASILLLAPLVARFGKAELAFPGGCVLGKRSTAAHEHALESLGVKNLSNTNRLKFTGQSRANDFVMQELSVTATENAVMLAALTPGKSVIRLAACEPHIQDLCEFLVRGGAKIKGIGTHTLVVDGTEKLKAVTHTVRGDYLEMGTWALAAALTHGEITITGGEVHDLDSFWQKFDEIGVPYRITGNAVTVGSSKKYLPLTKLETGVHPKFPTDLQAPFGVLLTQCRGRSRIFEVLFEGRLGYLYELEKMRASFEVINAHEAMVFGPCKLRGAEVSSLDIRAGAAMVLAGLTAQNETLIHDVQYFYRGYEDFAGKVRGLGGDIEEI